MNRYFDPFIISVQEIELQRTGRNDQGVLSIAKARDAPDTVFSGHLHPEEQTCYNEIITDKKKQSFLLGRLAGKAAVARLTGIEDPGTICITPGVFHFPVVSGGGVSNTQLSISHSRAVAMAVAFPEAHPMGIDVETIAEANKETIHRVLTPSEKLLLGHFGMDNAIGATVIWSAREALSKVLKTGLTISFELLKVKSIDRDGPAFTLKYDYFMQYKAIVIHDDQYVVALVLPANSTINCIPLYDYIVAALK